MRRYALPLALFGLFILLLQLNPSPIEITHQENLTLFPSNQQLLITGTVIKEFKSRYTTTLTLDSGLVLRCERCPSYLNKKISAIALLDTYNNKQQLHVLKISA